MNMTAKQAIEYAQNHARLERIAPEVYSVRYYDTTTQTWHESPRTKRALACRELSELRCRVAFQVAGFKADQAADLAHRETNENYPRDWRTSVRRQLRLQAAG